jgi:hypothetical protein
MELGSLAIAIVAIILSGVSTWEQFFHKSSSLQAVVQGVSLDTRMDPPQLRLGVLIMNASETPGVLRRAHLFLSADGSTPGGAHSSTPNDTFWWGETLADPIVVGENSIRQIDMALNLDAERLARYQQMTGVDPESGTWQIGVVLISMDIEGGGHIDEAFVGEVRANGLGVMPGAVQPLELY